MTKSILISFLLASMFANAEDKAIPEDPFDLTVSTKKVKEFGVITKAQVDQLETTAKKLFTAGDCGNAIKALGEYAKKANWLANMISANLDPYYTASS